MSTFDDDVFVNMVNRHNQDLRNERIKQGINNYNSAVENSVGHSKREYNKKRKLNPDKVRISIVAIILAAAIGLGVGSLVTGGIINGTNVLISETTETKDYVDDRISYYEKLMGVNGDDSNRIENAESRDVSTGELRVSYNNKNLAKMMYDAAQVSETEMRCVVIAAYRIINEPYREKILKSAFSTLKEDYSLPSNLEDLAGNGLDGFLNFLGYEDLEDYNLNERKSIKDLKVIEEFMVNRTGRR